MKRRYKIMMLTCAVVLIGLLAFNIHKKLTYEAYIQMENANSISAVLAAIERNDETLSSYRLTGEITYSELSRIGNTYLHAMSELVSLHRQVRLFLTDDRYDEDDFTTVMRFFDGISLYISMDLLHGTGNYYPELHNDQVCLLDQDEGKVLGHIDELNQQILNTFDQGGVHNTQTGSREYSIDLKSSNGLGHLVKLIGLWADETERSIQDIETQRGNKEIEIFLSRLGQ